MMKNIRNELDEVKNTMKGKMVIKFDGMIKRMETLHCQCFGVPITSQILSPTVGGL